jgi:hypothetical protein
MSHSDIRFLGRIFAATDATFLSTHKAYAATASQLALGTDAGTATFQASDGLYAHNITLTATVDHSGKTFSVVGVKIDGTTATDNITGPAAGATVSGTIPFKSITEINVTGGPTDSLAVGIGRIMAVPISRVKQVRVTLASAGDISSITFRDGSTSTGELKMKLDYPASTDIVRIDCTPIPNAGMRFEKGGVVNVTSGVASVGLWFA